MKDKTRNITFAALFIAIGLILPFFTGQIPQIGKMLLPMHLPVLLCGLVCGWKLGGLVGFALPLLRGAIFGMPVIFPTGVSMAAELATYGIVIGLVYGLSKWQCIRALYKATIIAMLAGRLVWAATQVVLLGLSGSAFTWQLFMAGAFINAVPGIVLQLVLIPTVMLALNRTGLIPFKRHNAPKEVAAG